VHLMDDASLVAAARSGDDTAWAAIYDRYADKLHDHCHRILRDRDEAADALHDAFLAAARNLHQLREPDRLRPWLYSICRHTSLRRLKARDRVDLTDQVDDMSAPEGDLDRGVRAAELSELVWAAAAGLNGRDQALLDLNLRQGLEGQDLADAMGTNLNNSYVMLSRLRDQVERSLGALLVARLGREDCEELSALLADWDGTFSPLIRKRVARHVDGCEICSAKRKAVASPLALLAAAPLVPAPALLKARVISSIRNVEVMDGPHIPFTKAGFAASGAGDGGRRPKAAWLLVAAAAVLLLGALFFATQDDDTSAVQTAGAPTTTTIHKGTRTLVTEPTTTTTAGVATDDTTDPTDTTDGSPSTTAGGKTSPPGGGGTTTTAPGTSSSTTATTKPGDTAPPTLGKPSFFAGTCSNGLRTTVLTVKASDPSAPVSVSLIGGPGGALQDGNHNGTFTRTFESGGGTGALSVRATDGAGNSTTAAVSGPLSACPPPTTTTTAPPTTSSSAPTNVG
jgi:RNA polymerase sigma factor (sigma-70 family)